MSKLPQHPVRVDDLPGQSIDDMDLDEATRERLRVKAEARKVASAVYGPAVSKLAAIDARLRRLEDKR